MGYTFNAATGNCEFADGTIYSVREMVFMAKADLQPDEEYTVHIVKKFFDGEIESFTRKKRVETELMKIRMRFRPAKLVRIKSPLPPLQMELDL